MKIEEKKKMASDFFSTYILAPLIFTLGLFQNAIGIKVFRRKKLNKIGPVIVYKFLFISDSLYF
jgi:hypothetical protein